ncbi:hypothetical protein HMPREF2534_04216 [Bacteroides thetaiotaomicron]|nr:hypothetical protein HMPREF2534_04216 [Bacteroides thetaiotaomicron]
MQSKIGIGIKNSNVWKKNKKNFSWFMESVWNLHLYSKSGLIVTF